MQAAARVEPPPAGPTYLRRQPERIVLYRVMQERFSRYILRPPLANDRLKILDDGDAVDRLGIIGASAS